MGPRRARTTSSSADLAFWNLAHLSSSLPAARDPVPSGRKAGVARQRGAGAEPGGDEDVVRPAQPNRVRFLGGVAADVAVTGSAACDAQYHDDGRGR